MVLLPTNALNAACTWPSDKERVPAIAACSAASEQFRHAAIS
jgi:hypothetical protein